MESLELKRDRNRRKEGRKFLKRPYLKEELRQIADDIEAIERRLRPAG